MTCQLARCIKAHKYPERVGWLVWVCAEAPCIQTALQAGTTDVLVTNLYLDTPYRSLCGRRVVVKPRRYELLPIFADCQAMSWEEMEARSGERMPVEKDTHQ